MIEPNKPNVVYQQNKKSGVIYAYEDRPYWDPEKKQSRSRRKMLGKVDPETGDIVPTRERKTKEAPDLKEVPDQEDIPEQAQEKPTCSINATTIINRILIFLKLFMCETLAKRVVSMVLIAVGVPESRVAELTGLCEKSVCTVKKGLENGEVDGMLHVVGGGRKGKLIGLEEIIEEEINNNNYHSHQQIADMIYEKHGIKVSLPVIGRLLKKKGLSG